MTIFDNLRQRYNGVAGGVSYLPLSSDDPNVIEAEVIDDDDEGSTAQGATHVVTEPLCQRFEGLSGGNTFDDLRLQMNQFNPHEWKPGREPYEEIDPTQTFISADYVHADGSELFPEQLQLPAAAAADPFADILSALNQVKSFDSDQFSWSNPNDWIKVLSK